MREEVETLADLSALRCVAGNMEKNKRKGGLEVGRWSDGSLRSNLYSAHK